MSWRLTGKYPEGNLLRIPLCITSSKQITMLYLLEYIKQYIIMVLLFPNKIRLKNLLLHMHSLKTLMIFHKLG